MSHKDESLSVQGDIVALLAFHPGLSRRKESFEICTSQVQAGSAE